MLYRRVGDSGLYVSVIGLGEWLTLGGQVDEEGTLRCMKQAYDLGINFFDAAEKYSTGQLEVALGRAIKRFSWKRSRLVISTMINYGAANGETSVNDHTLSRKHVIEATIASLKRLDLEYVDIVRAHRPDQMTPMEETVRAFNYLIENGLAFYWGTSMWSADEIAEACRIAKVFGLAAPIVEQPVYNLLDRQKVDGEFHRLYSKYGMGLVTTSPLKNGVLAADLTPAQPTSRVRFADMADGQHGVSANRPPTHENTAYSRKVERLKVSSSGQAGGESGPLGTGMVSQTRQCGFSANRSIAPGTGCRQCAGLEGAVTPDDRGDGGHRQGHAQQASDRQQPSR
ncbi:hypothetical protein LOZ12_003489 [Ophidiomyces ophidiicola]|nr:hypothetical protein LOZ62_003894 [Ophidiomyces ophidiicola]KAI1947568.1 hypothetical protein LOZ59_006595 [Ophidiomyces ophidiicola]KAI1964400.1 hypothetical protein LOZ56_006212 [Ophidiomyces ophidiicola]KAI2005366.1 hypothetical protein LOZ50_003712 [Ophidiomyces ophidiicola]KAI2016779.1 hypothetical protein LOZ45_006523 [Ophidiomyces ophidiicola]